MNVVGYYFQYNNISAGCFSNFFSDNITYLTIPFVSHYTYFNKNTIGSAITGIDFTSATHVYNDYNTTIFINASFAVRLSYFDGSDVLTIVNANA
jgi:hypothetical protein